MKQMRKAFEAWAKDYSDEFDFTTTPSGTYIDHVTYGAWIGYRAGLAALSAVPNHVEDALKMVQSQAQQPAQEPTCPQCGVRSGNGHCLGDIWNCSDMPAQEPEKLKHHPICDGRYPALCKACIAEAQQPAQDAKEKDIAEAVTLLSAVFDAWENGTDCYDDFDGVSGSFIGKAFNLDYEIFKRCCSLLNRINPPRNVSQQPAQEPATTRDEIFKIYCEDKDAGDWHRPQENYEAGYRKGLKDSQP
jgi:hypothetical protein